MDRTPYIETFDNGPGGWCAWGTGSHQPELKNGAFVTRSPWRVDPNHSAPGAGYLHLLAYLYTHADYLYRRDRGRSRRKSLPGGR